LNESGVTFERLPKVDGLPDVIFPSSSCYEDQSYPTSKLVVLGIKTTCKDRWRQVLHEAKRIKKKHLLTTQQGLSVNQFTAMSEAGVTLVVPKPIQKFYPAEIRKDILSVETFIEHVRTMIV
jgi:type II restriction enzyme